jgi:hypothetical protein
VRHTFNFLPNRSKDFSCISCRIGGRPPAIETRAIKVAQLIFLQILKSYPWWAHIHYRNRPTGIGLLLPISSPVLFIQSELPMKPNKSHFIFIKMLKLFFVI